jgi:hypothetical protein
MGGEPQVSGFVIFAFSGVKKSDFNRKDRRERKELWPGPFLEGPEVSGFVIFAFSGVKNQILTAKIAESAKSGGLRYEMGGWGQRDLRD